MEPTRTLSIPTIPQAIGALYQAVMLGQKAGIYSLDDANQISIALHALRFRLHLDQQMRPLWSHPGQAGQQGQSGLVGQQVQVGQAERVGQQGQVGQQGHSERVEQAGQSEQVEQALQRGPISLVDATELEYQS